MDIICPQPAILGQDKLHSFFQNEYCFKILNRTTFPWNCHFRRVMALAKVTRQILVSLAMSPAHVEWLMLAKIANVMT